MSGLFRGARLLGAPSSLGQKRAGVALAPRALRDAGLASCLAARGVQLFDAGDVSLARPPSSPPRLEELAEHCARLAHAAYGSVQGEELCLAVGGDHSIALGSIAGLLRAYPTLGVIWVDAHGDINLPRTSPSGNFHGMPLAALLGLFEAPESGMLGFLTHRLQASRLALVGVRDLDPFERDILRELRIATYSIEDVRRRGAEAVTDEALARISSDGGAIHLSFDIDALDPIYAPSTGCRVPNGLTLSEGRAICRRIARTERLVGMDLVEVNPEISPFCGAAARTIASAMSLIGEALGAEAMPSLRTSDVSRSPAEERQRSPMLS